MKDTVGREQNDNIQIGDEIEYDIPEHLELLKHHFIRPLGKGIVEDEDEENYLVEVDAGIWENFPKASCRKAK